MSEQQSYSSHVRLVPAFHFFLLPVLAINFISSLIFAYRVVVQEPAYGGYFKAGFGVLLASSLIALALLSRLFALGVQDRVIRLEERLRYQQLLPADLKPRIDEFTINQLVSLRFASNAELPLLARKVLDSGINDRRAIKLMIQNWRPDYQRI